MPLITFKAIGFLHWYEETVQKLHVRTYVYLCECTYLPFVTEDIFFGLQTGTKHIFNLSLCDCAIGAGTMKPLVIHPANLDTDSLMRTVT